MLHQRELDELFAELEEAEDGLLDATLDDERATEPVPIPAPHIEAGPAVSEAYAREKRRGLGGHDMRLAGETLRVGQPTGDGVFARHRQTLSARGVSERAFG